VQIGDHTSPDGGLSAHAARLAPTTDKRSLVVDEPGEDGSVARRAPITATMPTGAADLYLAHRLNAGPRRGRRRGAPSSAGSGPLADLAAAAIREAMLGLLRPGPCPEPLCAARRRAVHPRAGRGRLPVPPGRRPLRRGQQPSATPPRS
jgi:hypothetical protein